MTREINFILNQELIKINNIDPNTTVLNYLREFSNSPLSSKALSS